MTLLEAAQNIQTREIRSLELVNEALAINEARAESNVFAFLASDAARAEAKILDQETKAGISRGRLHGVPVTIKDLFNVANMPTKAGTNAVLPLEFQNVQSDSSAVKRLRDAGAVILGKTNMHEIALGVTGENPITGDVKNALDPSLQAGGSSSGSAVSVAAGIGFASLGSDTGGSLRIPASFNGVVGFKPSFGVVPLGGALHLSMTCDHAGPITQNVADAHAVLEVLAARAFPIQTLETLKNLSFGVPRVWLEGRLGVEVRHDFEALTEQLRKIGATVIDLNPNDLELASPSYTPIVRAEAAFVHRETLKTGGQGFSEGVLPPLQAGSSISASEYLEAQALRRQVRSGLESVLNSCDALILPAAPLPAPKRGTSHVTLESGTVTHRNAFLELTAPFSLVGLPTLSMPFTKVDGLPVGLQIVGARTSDAHVIEIGLMLEKFLSRLLRDF
jgi:aspartyl-tRNA(Asn)/glutamyl-tRNA(Gln) amidotransferase subunit A